MSTRPDGKGSFFEEFFYRFFSRSLFYKTFALSIHEALMVWRKCCNRRLARMLLPVRRVSSVMRDASPRLLFSGEKRPSSREPFRLITGIAQKVPVRYGALETMRSPAAVRVLLPKQSEPLTDHKVPSGPSGDGNEIHRTQKTLRNSNAVFPRAEHKDSGCPAKGEGTRLLAFSPKCCEVVSLGSTQPRRSYREACRIPTVHAW
jgi:hypothetical protein